MEIQQQRPTRQEFTDAAIRFDENNYAPLYETSFILGALIAARRSLSFMPTPYVPLTNRYSKNADRSVIQQEQTAEGYVVGEENIGIFARNQLVRHDKIDH